MNLQDIWGLLKETAAEWQLNQVSLLASSLAYYTIFSLAPLMIIIIMIVGAIFGEAAAQGELVGRLESVVGDDTAQIIETAIANLRNDTDEGPLRLIFTIGFLLFGASGVFVQIQNALDRIWGVKPQPGRHVFTFVRKRMLSFVMVLVIASLLIAYFLSNIVLSAVVDVLADVLPADIGQVWQGLSFAVFVVGVTLLIAAMYKILPDAHVEWRDAGVGACLTAILFILGQFLFSLFLGQTNFGSAYGVAGSFLILVTWIYYTAHILFVGAEFTKVYAKRRGSPIVPDTYAVAVTEQREEAQQDNN